MTGFSLLFLKGSASCAEHGLLQFAFFRFRSNDIFIIHVIFSKDNKQEIPGMRSFNTTYARDLF